MRKVKIFIASSLDGFIAKPNDDLSFLKLVEKEGEDYGYAEFTSTIDTLIIGRKTYDWVVREIGKEHYENGTNDVYVMTSTPRPSVGRTIFYSDKIELLIKELKSTSGKDIYCDGGAEVIYSLLKQDLVDELTISVIPVLLGNGIRLFKENAPELSLELIRTKQYESGLVQLTYKRTREL